MSTFFFDLTCHMCTSYILDFCSFKYKIVECILLIQRFGSSMIHQYFLMFMTKRSFIIHSKLQNLVVLSIEFFKFQPNDFLTFFIIHLNCCVSSSFMDDISSQGQEDSLSLSFPECDCKGSQIHSDFHSNYGKVFHYKILNIK